MKKVKQISAIIGIAIIVAMYIVSLISSFFATEYAPGLFLASIFSTVVIPIMIYLFIMVYERVRGDNQLDNTQSQDTADMNSLDE